MANPNPTLLDQNQILQRSFDEIEERLRVETQAIISVEGGVVEVAIDQATDSIRIGDGTNLVTTTTSGPEVGLDVNVINPINVEIDAVDGDSVMFVGTEDGTPSGVQHTARITSNNKLQVEDIAGNASLVSIDSKLTSPLSVAQSGTWNINNISGTISLPTGASTDANQTSIITNTNRIPAQGSAAISASTPINLANALTLTTSLFNSATGLINTNILNGIVSGWYDAAGFNQMAVTIYTTTTVTAGVLTFETTDDIVNDPNGTTINLQNETVLTQTNVTTLTLVANTISRFRAPISKRYIRFRLSTAFAGTGTVGATLTLKQTPYAPIVQAVTQATASSLNANIGSVATVSSVTAANLNIPAIVIDVASAALITTTTTAAFAPGFGISYKVSVPVTVVSGTNPTLDIQIQESNDTGTNWYSVYDFPRITTTGFYQSPLLTLTGNRVRYVQTVAGTTPSFTRSISRMQSSQPSRLHLTQLINRTIDLLTLNSVTPSLNCSNCNNIMVEVNIGTTTIAPAIQIQGSDDFGNSWYNIGTPLVAVASSVATLTVPNVNTALVRAIVTTAGIDTISNYVLIRCY